MTQRATNARLFSVPGRFLRQANVGMRVGDRWGFAHMHRFVVASLAGAGLSVSIGGAATAADLSPAPAPIYTKAPEPVPYSWTGLYGGVQAGYGWSGDDVNTVGGPISFYDPGATAAASATMNASAAAATMDYITSPKGFVGGGTLGYNVQYGQFVWGVETDLSWADVKGTVTAGGTAPLVGFPYVVNSSGTVEQKMDAFGTLRVRLGFLPTDKLLIFGTGGLAYGHLESNTNIAEALAPVVPGFSMSNAIGSASSWQVGWTAGAGLEYAFAPHWTAKAEYLYYDLGSISYNSGTIVGSLPPSLPAISTAGFSSSADFKGNIVRGGLNYHF
jgi:outer membrane immunogenic protein